MMKISEKTTKNIIMASSCWIAAIAVFWFTGNQLFAGSGEDTALIIQIILIAIPLFHGISALFLLAASHGFTTIAGKIWSLLGCGLACWLTGEVIYSYYELMGQAVFPSVADVFYMAGYLPLAVGLIFQMSSLKIKLHRGEKVLSLGFVGIVTLLIGSLVLYPAVVKMVQTGEDTLVIFGIALYPLFDIVLLACVIVVFGKLYHGKLNVAWMFILIGLVVNTLGDCLYWVSFYQGDYHLFNFFDLAFITSYVLIFVGALKLISIMTTTFEKPKDLKA